MPDPNEQQPEREDIDDSSAHPKDWPGIPGRSAEHEPQERKAGSEVTEEQRDLERRVEKK